MALLPNSVILLGLPSERLASSPSKALFSSGHASWPVTTTTTRKKRSASRAVGRDVGDMDEDLYDLLGVDSGASPTEIKQSYRWLQKKCHPDVAGPAGHDMAILLNQAYSILLDPAQKAVYDQARVEHAKFKGYTGQPLYSDWSGATTETRAVFVDEIQCVGCLKCALIASKTFSIETKYGRARAVKQWGDPEPIIEDAIEACPVDCISWVERSQLPALEFVMSKQSRFPASINPQSNGGARVENVFNATEKFIQNYTKWQLRMKSRSQETEAQREARLAAMEEVQVRAGRWWHHFFVGKKMGLSSDLNNPSWRQGAMIPLDFVKTTTSGGSWGGARGGALPDELERLFRAATKWRKGGSTLGRNGEGGDGDDEYWIPSSSGISNNNDNGTNNQANRRPPMSPFLAEPNVVEVATAWTFSPEERLNAWVKGVISSSPLAISTIAAVATALTGVPTEIALSEPKDVIPTGLLPIDLTNSLALQVFLAAAVWYAIGAATSSAVRLFLVFLLTQKEEQNTR